MIALRLFRIGYDTVEIGIHLGVTDAEAEQAIHQDRANERMRNPHRLNDDELWRRSNGSKLDLLRAEGLIP